MVPSIQKKVTNKDIIYYIVTIFTLILTLFILNIKSIDNFVYENNFISNIQVILIGFIEAFTMVVPGISGTAIFLILGYYEFIMELFSSIFIFITKEIFMVILFFSSFLFSLYLISIWINFMLSKYKKITYAMILGFGYSSIFLLLKDVLIKLTNPIELIVSIFLMSIGFIISKKFE